jgi:hypothetical protein
MELLLRIFRCRRLASSISVEARDRIQKPSGNEASRGLAGCEYLKCLAPQVGLELFPTG